MKNATVVAVLLTCLVTTLSGCEGKRTESEAYSALLSTLSALHHGNTNSQKIDEIDMESLADNGYMSPGYYPYVEEKLSNGKWQIKRLSDSKIEIVVKDSKDYCSKRTAIDTFAMNGVVACNFDGSTLSLTMSRS